LIRYLAFKEKIHSDNLGCYISFGIKVVNDNNDVLSSISDISLNEDVVKDICRKCTAEELDPIHLIDVIMDNI